MSGLLSEFAGPLMGLLGLIAGLLAAWFAGKTKGTANAKVEAAEQRIKDNDELAAESIKKNEEAAKQQIDAVVTANEQDQDVNAMSDNDVLDELYNKWGTKGNDSGNSKK